MFATRQLSYSQLCSGIGTYWGQIKTLHKAHGSFEHTQKKAKRDSNYQSSQFWQQITPKQRFLLLITVPAGHLLRDFSKTNPTVILRSKARARAVAAGGRGQHSAVQAGLTGRSAPAACGSPRHQHGQRGAGRGLGPPPQLTSSRSLASLPSSSSSSSESSSGPM